MNNLLTRHTVFYAVCLGCLVFGVVALIYGDWWWLPALLCLALSVLGAYDLRQTHHSVRRNYPVIGNLRYFFEFIRPEIRQYFVESDSEELPFSRTQRSLVYQRAKRESDKRPFGTQENVYGDSYEWINHSMAPKPPSDPSTFRITVGGPDCTQPYSLSVLNISAMSFGALSANAVRALNKVALLGPFV